MPTTKKTFRTYKKAAQTFDKIAEAMRAFPDVEVRLASRTVIVEIVKKGVR